MSRFKNHETEQIWEGLPVRKLDKAVRKQAYRKLQMLMAATRIEDLKVPPGNKLKPLKGDKEGYHSIRVNDQYRLCFVWKHDGAFEIELVDYH